MGLKKTIPELTDKELISAWKEADDEADPRAFADLAVEVQKRFTNYNLYLGLALFFPVLGFVMWIEEEFSNATIIGLSAIGAAIPLTMWAYGRWKMSRVLLKTGHTWFNFPNVDQEKLAELRKYTPKSKINRPIIDVENLPKIPKGENIDARGPKAALVAIPLTLCVWLACYIFIVNGTLLESLGIEIRTNTKFKYMMTIICGFHFPLQLWLRFRTPKLDRRD